MERFSLVCGGNVVPRVDKRIKLIDKRKKFATYYVLHGVGIVWQIKNLLCIKRSRNIKVA